MNKNKEYDSFYDIEYINPDIEELNDDDYDEIIITEKNEKVFTDGIDEYYRFANEI